MNKCKILFCIFLYILATSTVGAIQPNLLSLKSMNENLLAVNSSLVLVGSSQTITQTDTLGIVSVGTDSKNRDIGYNLSISLITASPSDSNAHEALEFCSGGFSEDVKRLRVLLNTYVQSESDLLFSLPDDPTQRDKEMERRKAAALASTKAALVLFQQSVMYKMAVCHASKNKIIPAFTVAITCTPCVIGSKKCPKVDAEGLDRIQKIANLYSGAHRLQKMKDWSLISLTGDIGDYDPKITVPPLPSNLTLSDNDIQTALTRKIERLRQKTKVDKIQLIAPVVASLSGLSQNDAIRIVDVLSSPNTTMRLAWNKIDQVIKVSDELARSRIHECTQFRGKTDLNNIASCAGYTLPDEKALYDCLSGELCRPTLAATVTLNIALITERLDLKNLALYADLPRIVDPKLSIPAFEGMAEECAKANRKDVVLMTTCLTKKQVKDQKTKDVLDCAQTAVSSKSGQIVNNCLNIALQNPRDQQLAQCLISAGSNKTEQINCSLQRAMPPEVVITLNCIREKTDTSHIDSCISDPTVKKLMEAKKCSEAGSTRDISVCLAQSVLGEGPAGKALGCMTQNAGDPKQGVACVVLQNIPGDTGRIIRCAASSGSIAGTAVCAVSPSLTPEQQIALSCAVTATTGPGYAICVGGQLTFREFMKCKDGRFAEGECFGEGNEIRKFARNILGTDIGPNSEIAKVINANLDVTRATIAFTEGAVREVEKAINDIGRGLSEAGKAASDIGKALGSGVVKTLPNVTVGSSGVNVDTPVGGIQIGGGHLVGGNIGGFEFSL